MRRKNTQMTTNILIVSLLLIGVVYALLQSNLNINGIAKILHNTWDVHFDNIQISEDSVPIGENDSAATIDPENNCKIDFEVTLSTPGDFYEFTVDVVNEGTIDGMIGTLNKTLTINNETVEETPDYLNYSITYDDGVEIEEHHKVSAGTVETYKVRLEFKTDIEELPQAATIVTSLEPQYVQADSSAVEVNHPYRLYNVFKEEYNSGSGLVREYTGEHKDSFTKDGTQKIYHWYGSNNTNGTAITNKNNVIFADHCWQMIRTTDTGGVKLLYNGIPSEGHCTSTGSGQQIGQSKFNSVNKSLAHVGYMYGSAYSVSYTHFDTSQSFSIKNNSFSSTSFEGAYKYSKTINDTGSGYELVNPILGINIPEDTYAGYYTFRSNTTISGTAPFYIVGLNSGTSYYHVQLSSTNNLNSFYLIIGDSITDKLDGTYELTGNVTSVSPIDWYTNYANYVGKYTCGDASTTICSSPRYIASTKKDSYNYLDASKKIMIGKTRSGLTLNDTLLLRYDELFGNISNYSSYKYTCNTTSAICTDETLRKISSFNVTGYSYTPNYYYGSSLSWDGTNYTLVNPISILDNNSSSTYSTHHYICLSLGLKSCSSVAYIYNTSGAIFYIVLNNGVSNIATALDNMLTKNKTNSTIKTNIETWYEDYLYDKYDYYIEDTIFCNDRSISQLGGWNDNGGMNTEYLRFKEYTLTSDLNCTNITDQFSVSNPKAPLTYKVGLMTSPEMNLLNNNNIRKTGQEYWLATPSYFGINTNYYSIGRYVDASGRITHKIVDGMLGVRPVVSLKPGTNYDDGDGSMEHPYVIKTN